MLDAGEVWGEERQRINSQKQTLLSGSVLLSRVSGPSLSPPTS